MQFAYLYLNATLVPYHFNLRHWNFSSDFVLFLEWWAFGGRLIEVNFKGFIKSFPWAGKQETRLWSPFKSRSYFNYFFVTTNPLCWCKSFYGLFNKFPVGKLILCRYELANINCKFKTQVWVTLKLYSCRRNSVIFAILITLS